MAVVKLLLAAVVAGMLTGLPAVALSQSGTTRRIEQPRDPALELTAKHNLEVARYYITKRKAYQGALDRLLEITETYAEFSRMDEVLFLIGEANQKISKQDESVKFFKRLLKDFPDSEFSKKAREHLAEMNVAADESKP
ncbi:MAG: hypothetical protein DMF61_25265 [Blastocatellia bacterium AA13]|nr:MAG: hypothetical protein DMF61_25265 [Blastocatellia bacterium AA13]